MGCDLYPRLVRIKLCISIHAPGWGATEKHIPHLHPRPISIHAPGWGATRYAGTMTRRPGHFNPRTRVGCDRRRSSRRIGVCYFNPRTRVGCDMHCSGIGGTSHRFQSTHPGGVRPFLAANDLSECRFQSTHPGGVRRFGFGLICLCFNFNPRTRVGCDSIISSPPGCLCISIHAPGWGATQAPNFPATLLDISIHAPGWGATVKSKVGGMSFGISIHAPGWGATTRAADKDVSINISIHAPGWGATLTAQQGK